MFNNIYNGTKVLITGHTGFKGSWLALWLLQLGAEITGYSLSPPTEPNHFKLLDVDMVSIIGDVRNLEKLKQVFNERKPEIVLHLAAQPIVRHSYQDPVETFTINVMGTINVLEAARKTGTVRAIVNVSSDKCYENREWPWGYREIDPLGGYDPYSASKGCSELITGCWRNSFFNLKNYGDAHHTLLASARAGNVIGGGDWAVDRLIPDVMRATSQNETVKIRNPKAIRPWQHVLEPLSGYLLLGQKLLEGRKEFAQAWNFGPDTETNTTVQEILNQARKIWESCDYEIETTPEQPHEANTLRLECSKARNKLNWTPVWNLGETVSRTIAWYKTYYERGKASSREDIRCYVADATAKNTPWAVA